MMERKLYTDSFEKMLREKSDEFRMYPSKKTWYSIYNNLYPGKRWPSKVMTLLCFSALLLIGYLNNSIIPKYPITYKQNFSDHIAIHTSFTSAQLAIESYSSSNNKNIADITHGDGDKSSKGLTISNASSLGKSTLIPKQIEIASHNLIKLIDDNIVIAAINNKSIKNNVTSEKKPTSSEKRNQVFLNDDVLNAYTIGNVQGKRWSDKLTLQVYASPSIVYGSLSGNKAISSGDDANNQFNENPSLGIEAGTAMQYALSGFIKLKAGVQFNYASYNLEAYQNDHPVMASLISTDPTTGSSYNITSRASLYSMNDGNLPVTLHNETYQLSLPVGLELKLLKNRNLQWNAGATIQPTFIAGGNAYMLSSDNRNYVDASSALNRWNLNAGFETFITYKVNGIVWQLGPQIRYQFLSIYGKTYTGVDERLANYGVKIGISKALR